MRASSPILGSRPPKSGARLKDFANEKDIKIIRKGVKRGEPISFNYKEALHGAAPVYIHAGDTVIVHD